MKIFSAYTDGKQSLNQLANFYRLSSKTIQRIIHNHKNTHNKICPDETVIIMDTYYFRRGFGVMVFRDNYRKKNLHWQYVKYETIALYKKGIRHLINEGWTILGLACDGRRGIFKAFRTYPIQMCQYHQSAIITRYLTNNPRQTPAIELKIICKDLTKNEQTVFANRLNNWSNKWKEFLQEKTIDSEHEKWHYTHKRLRSAIRSLNTHMEYLFVYRKYPDLDIPNTTNSLEGYFNNLANKLRNHPRINDETKKKLVDHFLTK